MQFKVTSSVQLRGFEVFFNHCFLGHPFLGPHFSTQSPTPEGSLTVAKAQGCLEGNKKEHKSREGKKGSFLYLPSLNTSPTPPPTTSHLPVA